jgi:membrane protease YdiL (CAAX protease family)
METDRIKLKTLTTAIFLILLCEFIGSKLPFAEKLMVIFVTRILEISSMVVVVFLMEKNLTVIGINRFGNLKAVWRGGVWSFGFGVLAAAGALALTFFDIEPFRLIRVQLPPDFLALLLFLLVGGVIGPVAEEFFFRGLVFRFFRKWGFVFSLLFSTMVFTAMHPMSSGVPVPQIVGGLLFASVFEFEKNLIAPVTVHILGNLAIFASTLLTS